MGAVRKKKKTAGGAGPERVSVSKGDELGSVERTSKKRQGGKTSLTKGRNGYRARQRQKQRIAGEAVHNRSGISPAKLDVARGQGETKELPKKRNRRSHPQHPRLQKAAHRPPTGNRKETR